MAVLSATDDGPQAWLAAGQALSAVLLRARAENVWASFFSQPIRVDSACVWRGNGTLPSGTRANKIVVALQRAQW